MNVIPVYDAPLCVTIIWFPKSVHHAAFHEVFVSCLIEREREQLLLSDPTQWILPTLSCDEWNRSSIWNVFMSIYKMLEQVQKPW